MSDQSTTERNLYSNALSISIIGEELPGTHNSETIALRPPRPLGSTGSPEKCVRAYMYVRTCAVNVGSPLGI